MICKYSYKSVSALLFIIFMINVTGCSSVQSQLAMIHLQKGKDLENQGLIEQAIIEYSEAIDSNPELGEAFFHRGQLYYQQARYDEGLPDLENAVRLDDKNAEAFFLVAMILLYQDESEKALPMLDHSLALDNQNAEGFYQRALIYLKKGELQDAYDDLSQSISMKIAKADAYYQRGKILSGKQQWEKAIEDFNQAIKMDAAEDDAYFERALGFLGLEKPDLALADLDKVILLNPDRVEAYLQRALLHQEAGNLEKAYVDFDKIIQLGAKSAEAYYFRGKFMKFKESYDQSLADFDQAININPQMVEAYFERGLVLQLIDELESAIADFNQVEMLSADYSGLHSARSLAFIDQGDYQAAMIDLNAMLDADPDDVRALMLRGYANFKMNKWDNAIKDYQAVVKVNLSKASSYKNAPALFNQGLVYARQGDLKRAADYFEKSINIQPSAVAYHAVGDVYFSLWEWESAGETYEKARTLDIDHSIPSISMEIAILKLLQGDLLDAAKNAEQYLDSQPEADGAEAIRQWAADLKAEAKGEARLDLSQIADLEDILPAGIKRKAFMEPGLEQSYRENPDSFIAKGFVNVRYYESLDQDFVISVIVIRLPDEEAQNMYALDLMYRKFELFNENIKPLSTLEKLGGIGYCQKNGNQTGCLATFSIGPLAIYITSVYTGDKPLIDISPVAEFLYKQAIENMIATQTFLPGVEDMINIDAIRE